MVSSRSSQTLGLVRDPVSKYKGGGREGGSVIKTHVMQETALDSQVQKPCKFRAGTAAHSSVTPAPELRVEIPKASCLGRLALSVSSELDSETPSQKSNVEE